MDRRQFLQLCAFGSAAYLLPQWYPSWAYPNRFFSPQVTPFHVPLPIPAVLTPVRSTPQADYYDIAMQSAQLQILPSSYPRTTVWAYNGVVPGPTIKARTGRQVFIKQTNDLIGVTHRDGSSIRATVHLHGGHVASQYDGHPCDLIDPGSSFTYDYPNIQDHANLWYHDHELHHTAENIYMGLAGLYILQDDLELSFDLPRDNYEVPLVIMDKVFHSDGSLFYPSVLDSNTIQTGFLGDTILVNGAIQPYLKVAKRKYRFRILDASTARQYRLALSNGQPFIQIGTDGGLLPAPVPRPSMRIGPAERLDVVIDFSTVPVGTSIELRNTLESASSRTYKIMRFDVDRTATDSPPLPSSFRTIPTLSTAWPTRYFDLALSGGVWTINGQTFPPNCDLFIAEPRLGATEVWGFRNFSPQPHPMHPHLVMAQFVRRFGPSGMIKPYEQGWKDTFNVQNGEEVHVAMKFTDFTGRYIFHCHNAEHEDHDMMVQYNVRP